MNDVRLPSLHNVLLLGMNTLLVVLDIHSQSAARMLLPSNLVHLPIRIRGPAFSQYHPMFLFEESFIALRRERSANGRAVARSRGRRSSVHACASRASPSAIQLGIIALQRLRG